MACTTGCPTKTCPSYAACLRGKATKVAYCNSAGGMDFTAQKAHDSELQAYRDAKKEGLQPEGTKRVHIDAARAIADKTGTAYNAAN